MTFEADTVNEWPKGTSGRRAAPPNPVHDALAKRLTDGETLKLIPEAGVSAYKLQGQIKRAMNARGIKTQTRVVDNIVYVRLALIKTE